VERGYRDGTRSKTQKLRGQEWHLEKVGQWLGALVLLSDRQSVPVRSPVMLFHVSQMREAAFVTASTAS
jgi:hypothetical protein